MKDPARVTEIEGHDALLAPGVRALRAQVGDAAAVRSLAERLEGALATDVIAGSAVGAKSLLLRFTLLGVVGLGIGAGLWVMRDPVPVERIAIVPETSAAPATAVEAPPAAEPRLERASEPRAVPARAAKQAVARAREPEAHRDPEAELALLGRAQTLLNRDPRASLQLLDEHVRSYPKGLFREEREVLALEAENKLGRKAAAVARAERFIAEFPRSAHARRVRALLEPAP